MHTPDHPHGVDDAVTVRRRRRSHPALLAFAAVAVSGTAIMTGASVSASTMPKTAPPVADVVTLGTMSANGGYQCTFTGKEAADLDARIRENVGDAESVPVEVAEGSAVAGVRVGAGAVRPTTVSSDEPPTAGTITGTAVAGGSGDLTITPLPGGPTAMSVDTTDAVRAGTAEECRNLVVDATDGKR